MIESENEMHPRILCLVVHRCSLFFFQASYVSALIATVCCWQLPRVELQNLKTRQNNLSNMGFSHFPWFSRHLGVLVWTVTHHRPHGVFPHLKRRGHSAGVSAPAWQRVPTWPGTWRRSGFRSLAEYLLGAQRSGVWRGIVPR